MTDTSESKIHKYGSNVDFWWKVSRAVIGFLALLGVAWTQWLGPGIKPAFQNFVGITEVVQRLEFVEQFMPAPRVVEWNEGSIRQIGDCNSNRCDYLLNGQRTQYGENCGRPTEVRPFIRTSAGQNIQILLNNYTPIELTREPISFTLPLDIPSFIPEGSHQFRIRLTYPDCRGRGEPIPRWTPWFPLTVSK